MSVASVQFSVATHIMTALAYRYGDEVTSTTLARSVNAEPTFVRKSLSKLAKAGLVITTRGQNGSCFLARPPQRITLLDIYRASEASRAFAVHSYPQENACPISCNIKDCMQEILEEAQKGFEQTLKKRTLAQLLADIRKKSKRAKSRANAYS